MGRHLLVVLTNAVDGRDEEFNRWYDEVHIPDVLGVPGYTAAQRFELSESVRGDSPYRYLALYEIEAEDVREATAGLSRAAAEMEISETLDGSRVAAWAFSPIGKNEERFDAE